MFMLTVWLLTLGQAVSPAQAPSLVLSAPAALATLDFGNLKGEPFRLAWSPDGSQLYLQTVERDSIGSIKAARHYLFKIGEKSPKRIDAEPAWASQYWAWKSGQAAPGRPALKIDVEQRQETRRTTSAPTGGDLARGGAGSSGGRGGGAATVGDVAAAAAQSQLVHVVVLRLRGEKIGEWVNAAVVPGLTFGWAPEGTGLIAFADPDGGLVLLDEKGGKQKVSGTRDVLLPAWSADAKRLAWIERGGRKKGTLRIAEVSQGSQ
jgi:hypothetical protein